jgi:hypothetical protein
VVARRQYAPAPPWPRQAPWWLQLGNLFEWADWQVALGLARARAAVVGAHPVTIGYAALGLVGARWHRARDRRTWRAVALLLLCGTVGVAAYLNLRAGPSYGYGILADTVRREARERDYFFALGFWAWGLWAGMGAVALARADARARGPGRRGRGMPTVAGVAGLAVAALPGALNWRAVEPCARWGVGCRGARHGAPRERRAAWRAAGARGQRQLSALVRAVIEGLRRDVTTVTMPLLGARWYRAELARRHGLLAPRRRRHVGGRAGHARAHRRGGAARGRPGARLAAVDARPVRRIAGARGARAVGAARRRAPARRGAARGARRGARGAVGHHGAAHHGVPGAAPGTLVAAPAVAARARRRGRGARGHRGRLRRRRGHRAALAGAARGAASSRRKTHGAEGAGVHPVPARRSVGRPLANSARSGRLP